MLRCLADEDFDNRILRGLRRVIRGWDCVRVQDVELSGRDDPTILAWAAREGRVLLSHDRQTLPGHAYSLIDAGGALPGVCIVDDHASFGLVISDLQVVIEASTDTDWENQVFYVPM